MRYVQPALAPGLARDHGLCLIALAGEQPLAPAMSGAIVRDFVDELYTVTEGAEPGVAPGHPVLAAIPDEVRLFELRR